METNSLSQSKEELNELESLISSRTEVVLKPFVSRGKWRNYLHFLLHPSEFAFPFLTAENRLMVRQAIERVQPDIIWSEHFVAASFSLFSQVERRLLIVYAHHDWEYKLRRFRDTARNTGSYVIRSLLIRFYEEYIVRRVAAVVSASWSEALECKQIGAIRSIYLPLFVSKPNKVLPDIAFTADRFRVFHLGGLRTTSNLLGLTKFLKYSWPNLKSQIPGIELVLIGSMDSVILTKYNSLFSDPSIKFLGFVKDVDAVLSPYAVHIIPWNQSTGVRTKVPIAMRNRQVIVGMRKSLSCFSELSNNESALIADSYDEMTSGIMMLYKSSMKLREIGDKAYEVFEKSYTIESQRERFAEFVNELS